MLPAPDEERRFQYAVQMMENAVSSYHGSVRAVMSGPYRDCLLEVSFSPVRSFTGLKRLNR
jgi:hypothetical protein